MTTRPRLAIVTTHPVQYHAPWFRALARQPEIDLTVFYCHRATPEQQAAAGFDVPFDWDVPLLDGYCHRFLKNVGPREYCGSFRGLDTPEIKEIIAGRQFEAVLVNGWHYKSAWQAIVSCWQNRIPVMLRGDSHLHTQRSVLKRYLKYPVYKGFIPRADACLAVGTWSREYFLHYGARPEHVFSVPHAIDERWVAAELDHWLPLRAELRQRWALAPDEVVFLFAGKFIAKKRPLDFVRAVAEARRRGAAVAGLMVGDGPLRAECEAVTVEMGAPVRFAGFLNQSQMISAYVAADVLVLPSDGRETWGLVVNEAMACGRPAIVSDAVGCGPDLILAGKTGNRFPLGNVEALSDLLVTYAERPEMRGVMAQSAGERLAAFSLGAAVDGIVRAMAAIGGKSKAKE
jgi:glycosyltransferase involved in cell wall biosynthesis